MPRWTQFETRRKLKGRHEHITERKQTYTQQPQPATRGQCCLADRHAAPVPGKPCPRQKGQASSCTDASTDHMWPRLWGAPSEAEVAPHPPYTPTGVPLPAHLCAAGTLTTRERKCAYRGLCPEPGRGPDRNPRKTARGPRVPGLRQRPSPSSSRRSAIHKLHQTCPWGACVSRKRSTDTWQATQ